MISLTVLRSAVALSSAWFQSEVGTRTVRGWSVLAAILPA